MSDEGSVATRDASATTNDVSVEPKRPNVLVRLWQAFDDRTGTGKLVGGVMRHPVPPTTKKSGWAYVFGSATLFAFITLVLTGIVLATAYIPATANAYDSLQFITHDRFGHIVRGIHYFAASAMIIMI